MSNRQRARVWGPPALFFTLFFFYVWLCLAPSLIYQAQEPAFFWGSRFFARFTQYPGGLTEYLAALLSQLFHFSWAGALLLTAGAGLVCLAGWDFLKAVGGRRVRFLALIPAIFLLAMRSYYPYPLAPDLGLLAALLFLVIYVRLAARLNPWQRLLFFTLLGLPLYYLVAGPFLLFALLCGIYELLSRKALLPGAFCLLAGLAFPYLLGELYFGSMPGHAYGRLLPFIDQTPARMASIGLYLFYLLAALWTGLSTRFLPAFRGRKEEGSRWIVQTAGLLLVAAVSAFTSFDANSKAQFRIDYCASQRDWQQLLEEASDLQGYNRLTVYHVMQALCHTGRIGDEMLAYPYAPDAPIFSPSSEATPHLKTLSSLLLELGEVNLAEHLASEALAILGEQPSTLKRLALINVLKGRPEAARVFLGLLEKNPLHKGWAEQYQRALDADPQLRDDEEIARIRSVMVDQEYAGYFDAEAILLHCLQKNSRNRLAFELLMAHYLQTGRLEKLAGHLAHLDDVGIAGIPRLYEEAALLYVAQVRKQRGITPELPLGKGRSINQQTLERFAAFGELFARHQGNRTVARRLLAQEHEDTYWFYYLFNRIGGGANSGERGDSGG